MIEDDGTINTRSDPDEVGDLVPAWDRFLDGDPDAFFDLDAQEQQRARALFPKLMP